MGLVKKSAHWRLLAANPFALASLRAVAPGEYVTGIFGAHVVAVDADTGSVIAGTLGGWCCNARTDSLQFDGTFAIERLPVGRDYAIYAEPLVELAAPGDFGVALQDLCSSGGASECATPTVDTNFSPRFRPTGP